MTLYEFFGKTGIVPQECDANYLRNKLKGSVFIVNGNSNSHNYGPPGTKVMVTNHTSFSHRSMNRASVVGKGQDWLGNNLMYQDVDVVSVNMGDKNLYDLQLKEIQTQMDELKKRARDIKTHKKYSVKYNLAETSNAEYNKRVIEGVFKDKNVPKHRKAKLASMLLTKLV